ncbi:MAG: hypothetical protein LV468_04850 [Candidatus Nitrosotenuis sp.]|uniref:hypothetical protein n=1 Tax=Candidatus Nitrosotenuis cloacae TaxID=1603555 RepID=UPI00227FAA5B|nr:hypothetical protein [Candidatus Nitrosotenuis cloacae]MDC8438313.1 hypothetical protein [Candidatus Nitrosotenuis sp.]
MRYARLTTTVGALIAAFGLVFQFQGRGQIGPESSFMYHNTDWIYYGFAIAIIGVMISGIGIFLQRRR